MNGDLESTNTFFLLLFQIHEFSVFFILFYTTDFHFFHTNLPYKDEHEKCQFCQLAFLFILFQKKFSYMLGDGGMEQYYNIFKSMFLIY